MPADEKVDIRRLAKLVEHLDRKYGKGTLYKLGSRHQNAAIKRVATGIPQLDEILGGGLPRARIVEIYGRESAGKTSLLYYLMSLFKTRLFINMEGTFDPERAAVFGNVEGSGNFLVSRPMWGEMAWDILEGAVESGIPLIGVDSVPAMIPRAVFEQKTAEDNARLGAVAKLMSERLPVLCAKAEKTGSTVVFVNQVRDVIGAAMFQDRDGTPGGRALKHYTSLRLQLAHRGFITKKQRKVGMITKVRVKKSKVGTPAGECELELIWSTGYKNG